MPFEITDKNLYLIPDLSGRRKTITLLFASNMFFLYQTLLRL